MISIDEELEAAKAAQAAINTLSVSALNPYIGQRYAKPSSQRRQLQTFQARRLSLKYATKS
jgi:hypothetical protein